MSFLGRCKSLKQYDIGLHALKFDGVNDKLENNVFNQFEKTQSFTFFAKLKTISNVGGVAYTIFDTRLVSGIYLKGLAFAVLSNGKLNCGLFGVSGSGSTDSYVIQTDSTVNPASFVTLQVTYNGSVFAVYVNSALVPHTILNNNLTTTITTTAGGFTIGQVNFPAAVTYDGGVLQEVSIVDFVKSGSQLTSDYNAGGQTIGSGAWLLAPVKPIYPDVIASLNSATTFPTVPSQYNMTILGKSPTMNLAIDFERI